MGKNITIFILFIVAVTGWLLKVPETPKVVRSISDGVCQVSADNLDFAVDMIQIEFDDVGRITDEFFGIAILVAEDKQEWGTIKSYKNYYDALNRARVRVYEKMEDAKFIAEFPVQ